MTERGPTDREPAVAVIVASRGRPAMLEEAVRSILDGDRLPAEIVVVDQSDRAHPVLGALVPPDGCRLVYLHRPGRGVSRARNVGAAQATCTHVAFIDDDVLVAPGWLAAIAAALDAGRGERAVSGCVAAGRPERPDAFAPSTLFDREPRVDERPGPRDVLYTNNAVVPAASFRAVGGFDERLGPGTRFPAAEDNDLGYRLLRSGVAIAYAPDAVVYHRAWRPPARLTPLRYRYGRGQGAFYAKHLRDDPQLMARRLTADLGRYGRRAARRVVGDTRGAAGDAAFLLGLLDGFASWLVREAAAGTLARIRS